MRDTAINQTGPCLAAICNEAFGGRSAVKKVTNSERRVSLTIYGNYLSLDAPANLQVDVQGLEKLYRLADVDAHGQVTSGLIAIPVVNKLTTAHKGKNVPTP